MTTRKLAFHPTIPPDINVGIVMKRVSALSASAPAIAASTSATLPAGTDAWYNVWNGGNPIFGIRIQLGAVIPYRLYDAELCADTPNDALTVDDDHDDEGDIPGLTVGPHGPQASAWWVLAVPVNSPGCWVTLDTWLTTGGESAAKPTDTILAILTATDGVSWAPQTFDESAVRFDFTGLSIVAQSDDDPDPTDAARPYTSKVTNVALAPGKTYFIRVDVSDADNVPETYRLRVSLTETAP